jgi:UDP-N-acetyl-D-mannosaminuronic acid dehydrogenase
VGEKICIVGLGYVGLTLAVAMAEAGCEVVGVEREARIREKVAAGSAHFTEIGLDAPLARHVAAGRLAVTDKVAPDPDVSTYIITVGTPLTLTGSIDLAALEVVLEAIALVLKAGDMVILRSTVRMGTTRNLAKSTLDGAGVDYDLAFCPERTLEGRALAELTSLPQIVGGLTDRSTTRAATLFKALAPNIVEVATLEAAEMVKLLNNTYRDLEFAFANEVAEICDAMGLSAADIIGAACRDYPRSKIPFPGPVGGPCLAKDTHILAESLRAFNYVPRLSIEGRRLNEELPRSSMARVFRKVAELGIGDLARRKIVMLGLAFKGRPETNDLRGTMAKPILEAMRELWPGAVYQAFDPLVEENEFHKFGVGYCSSLAEAFAEASLIVVQNNHPVFAAMPVTELAGRMRSPGMIYDYWNLFAKGKLDMPPGRTYCALGAMG